MRGIPDQSVAWIHRLFSRLPFKIPSYSKVQGAKSSRLICCSSALEPQGCFLPRKLKSYELVLGFNWACSDPRPHRGQPQAKVAPHPHPEQVHNNSIQEKDLNQAKEETSLFSCVAELWIVLTATSQLICTVKRPRCFLVLLKQPFQH